jgi:hypothetical protein
MSRSLALFAIGLIFGGGVGFVLAAGRGSPFDSHDHADPSQHGSNAEMAAHDHSAVTNLPADSNAPSVAIKMIKDPMAGWNLHVTPQNFRFSPENASTEEILGEGHAHVYINGEKLGRLYANWIHLPSLPDGDVEIKVSLNGNSHSPLMVGGLPVEAKLIVQADDDGS